MGSTRVPFTALGAAAVLIVALGGSTVAQSAAPSGSAVPAASPDAGASPLGNASPTPPVAVGPITWSKVQKGKDFTTNPAVYGVGQLPDGRLMVVGSTSKDPSRPSAAAWVSNDGSKWSRFKGLKAPKGSHTSIITAIANLGATAVATGDAGDGTGLAWTSTDGTTWTASPPVSGTIYDMTPTSTGLVGVGYASGVPTAWATADGITWQPTALAPSGYAVHVMTAPDGSLVAAGTVPDASGAEVPVVCNSPDGTTWSQTTLPGMKPGIWAVPAAAATPAGLVIALSEPGQTGRIGHVWSSPDGGTWTETFVDQDGFLSAAGSAGPDALLVGHGTVLRSPDGVTWTATAAKPLDGWDVRDVMTLDDGRLFAAGDFGYPESSMATWTGTADPLP